MSRCSVANGDVISASVFTSVEEVGVATAEVVTAGQGARQPAISAIMAMRAMLEELLTDLIRLRRASLA